MRKSMNGMDIMKANPLSPTEISDIIKTCGIYGVSRIKIRGLEVEFHKFSGAQGPAADQIQILERQIQSREAAGAVVAGEKLPTITEAERQKLEEDFFNAQRLIDDPQAHEDALVDDLIQKGKDET